MVIVELQEGCEQIDERVLEERLTSVDIKFKNVLQNAFLVVRDENFLATWQLAGALEFLKEIVHSEFFCPVSCALN